MPHAGICAYCGKEFISTHKDKLYCNMDCYYSDPVTRKRLADQAKSQRRTVIRECAYCGAELVRKPSNSKTARVYCNHDHYRAYLADRFDRWIADPQDIAMPQNFDEYMMQKRLPCLVKGCDWVGENLSNHVNLEHGITAAEFKRIAGFNTKTGLVAPELRQIMRERALLFDWDFRAPSPTPTRGGSAKPRPEGREHYKKAMALLRADYDARTAPTRPCRWCGQPVIQPPVGKTLYCCSSCRTSYYNRPRFELVCTLCGSNYLGSPYQHRRAQNGLPITCSMACRQKLNSSRARKKEDQCHVPSRNQSSNSA